MLKRNISYSLFYSLVLFIFLITTGCTNHDSDTHQFSGTAIKGVISNGLVRAYSTEGDKQLLGEARTNQFGYFVLQTTNEIPANTYLLLELSVDQDTRMRCDLTIGCMDTINQKLIGFGDDIQLPSNFKLRGIASSDANQNVSAFISPLSHLIVSTATQNGQSLTKNSIEIASNWVNDAFKLSQSPIQTQTTDITQLFNHTIESEEQLKHSVISAALYPETLSLEWSLGHESIDKINLKTVLTRATELAADLSTLLEEASPNKAVTLNKIQSDTEAQLVVLGTPEITIISQPNSVTTTENESFNFYIQANSSLELSYQWYKNGSLIPEANSATYSKQNSSSYDSGLYHVVVSNGLSERSSLPASLTVNEVEQALQITQQPIGLSITEGDALSLSVSVIGDSDIRYQWQKNGSLIPGATSNTYFIPISQATDAGSYRVVISNDSKQINSNFVNVWVTETIQAISINQQPQSQVIPEGNNAKFTVLANGGGFIRYQWRKNGIAIPNAFDASLSITAVKQTDNGIYDVVVSNSQGSLVSSPASLSVIDNRIPVMITHQTQSQTVVSGMPFALSVSASGDAPLNYQWFIDGNAIVAANSAQYLVPSASVSDQGIYTVLVSNPSSSELSEPAFITVNQPQLASIELTWDTPTQREDGSPLSFSEIQSYVIEYGTSLTKLQNRLYIVNQLPNSTVINELLPGTLFLRIATIDSDGVQGTFSDTISITIP